VGGNRWRSQAGDWVPLYVGRMIHQFDHRAASVVMNDANLHNPALSEDISAALKADAGFLPRPQFWVPETEVNYPGGLEWAIAFRDIARATDERTMIASAIPRVGTGNTLPLLLPNDDVSIPSYRVTGPYLLANLNAAVFDYVTRQKAQTTHLNLYIVEQLPVIPPAAYASTRFGPKTAGDIVRDAVLELTYTAHDMAPFARDLGYVAADGTVKPPFIWDDARRLTLRAKLDAVYFHLYGVVDRDDVRYIYSTFPIVERSETESFGEYRSRDLCLAYMNALAAGDPDAIIAM
jgi:hypothetical protein